MNCYIKAEYSGSSYLINLAKLTDERTHIKVDTGAVITIISLKALYPNVDDNTLKKYRETLLSKHRDKLLCPSPKSASGHDIECIPCIAKNVILHRTMIDEFYYYVALNVETEKLLLGDDFLSCCKFEHAIKSDIEIMEFDIERYKQKFNIRNNYLLTMSELNELCVGKETLYVE